MIPLCSVGIAHIGSLQELHFNITWKSFMHVKNQGILALCIVLSQNNRESNMSITHENLHEAANNQCVECVDASILKNKAKLHIVPFPL